MRRSFICLVACVCWIQSAAGLLTAETPVDAGILSLWSDSDSWGGLADRRPSGPTNRFRAAKAHQSRNQWLLAEDSFTAGLKSCPPITPRTVELNRTALTELGISQAMSGRPDAARKTLNAVESKYSGGLAGSEIGRLQFVVGFAYFISASNAAAADGETDSATWFGAHTLRRVFNLSGKSLSMPDSAFSGATMLFSETQSVSDATAKALSVFDAIVIRDPDGHYADAALLISGILLRKTQEYKEALTRYEKLIENYASSPTQPFACMEAAEALLQIKDRPIYDFTWDINAERYFRRAAGALSGVIGPVADRLREIGELIEKRRVDRAVARARFYLSNNEIRAAEIVLDEARRAYPGRPAARAAERLLMDIRSR